MRFSELVDAILSYPNGSVTTKNGTYYSDIYLFTKRFRSSVAAIRNPAQSTKAVLLKEQLEEILKAIEDKRIRVKSVGARK